MNSQDENDYQKGIDLVEEILGGCAYGKGTMVIIRTNGVARIFFWDRQKKLLVGLTGCGLWN